MTNYDFTGKSIKCETWEQMLHLAKLAEEQGCKKGKIFSIDYFSFGNKCFFLEDGVYDCCVRQDDNTEMHYSEFIPQLPNEVVEVTGCKGCIFHENRFPFEHICNHPKYEQPTFAKTSIKKLFITCPLKTKSITIKLKNNDTQTQTRQTGYTALSQWRTISKTQTESNVQTINS
jgi:hypothetical protein